MCKVVYVADAEGRCFALVTSTDYPTRVAIRAIEELKSRFAAGSRLSLSSLTDPPATFAPKCKPILRELCSKYNEPREVDALTDVMAKVRAYYYGKSCSLALLAAAVPIVLILTRIILLLSLSLSLSFSRRSTASRSS